MKRVIFILIFILFVSCAKKDMPVHEADPICFTVFTPDVFMTRAEVTRPGIMDRTDAAYVYGMKSLGSESNSVFEAPGVAELIYDSELGLWVTQNSDDTIVTWESGGESGGQYYYRFYGYAYNSNAVVGDNLVISNDVYGRQFKVVQPQTATWAAPSSPGVSADDSGTIDYLLSYLVNVPPSTNYPLVPLHFEHALAKVEVDIQVANSMFVRNDDDEITGCAVKDITVTVSGVERGATMLCLQPKLDGESGTNTWYVSLDSGLDKASYTITDVACLYNAVSAQEVIDPDMSFLAVPVTNAQMADYKLTLSYNNDSSEDGKSPADYTYEFNLQEFSSQGWLSAHRVKYVLTIDNSIRLSGSIMDYEDVDYIEAPLIPDIQ